MVSEVFHLSPTWSAVFHLSVSPRHTHTYPWRRLQIPGHCRVQESQGRDKAVQETDVNEISLGWEPWSVETAKHLEQAGVNQIDFCKGRSE